MQENPKDLQQNSPAQKGSGTDPNNQPADSLGGIPSAPVMSDREGSAGNENMFQNATDDREVTPEFGDAADPTQEELGTHHRDE